MLFDIVTANPHRSASISGAMTGAENDKVWPFSASRSPPKTKGDYGLISHMIETLKPNWLYVGVVVRHGIAFPWLQRSKIRQKTDRDEKFAGCGNWPAGKTVLRYGSSGCDSDFQKAEKWMTRCCLSMRSRELQGR